jgi:hypothetical protein
LPSQEAPSLKDGKLLPRQKLLPYSFPVQTWYFCNVSEQSVGKRRCWKSAICNNKDKIRRFTTYIIANPKTLYFSTYYCHMYMATAV